MDYPKNIKKLIKQYAEQAYEIELRTALGKLDESFAEWREGKITSFDLNGRIHKFHKGISAQLYRRYDKSNMDFTLAYAIVAGILDREKLPEELLDSLNSIGFFESLKEKNELREPGDYS
jgi:hypothetical protein